MMKDAMIHTGKDEGKSHKDDRATLPQQRAGFVELTEAEVRVIAGGRISGAVAGWRVTESLQEL